MQPGISAGTAAASSPRRSSPRSTSCTAAYAEAQADPEFQAELARLLRDYTGRPSPLTEVPRFAEHAGGARIMLKREDLNHTGSHKINNVLGPGAADQAHGQDAGDRRDRRRPARRRHGDRGGAVRPRVRHLHGRGGHRAAGAQRRPDAAARRRGRPGHHRLAHAQGRHQRGDARLGHQRRAHALPARHRRRTAPVPRDGARLPARHRRRGARAGARADRRACPTPWRPASAAGPTRSGIFRAFVPDDPTVRLYGFEAGGRRRRDRPARRLDHRRRARACCTARAPTCCRTRTGRPSSRTRSRPGSTTRASGRSTPGCTTSAGPTYRPITDARGDGGLRAAVPHRGHHPGDRVAPTPWPARVELGAELGPDAIILVNLSGRGDKDMETASRYFGLRRRTAGAGADPASRGGAAVSAGRTRWPRRAPTAGPP